MEKSIVDPTPISYTPECCGDPTFSEETVKLVVKLHQVSGYIEYTCENCGVEHTEDFYVDRKETYEGDTFDPNADIPAPSGENCTHNWEQRAVKTENSFEVNSECSECGQQVSDILVPT